MLEPDSFSAPSSSRPKSDAPHSATISTSFDDDPDSSTPPNGKSGESGDFFASLGTEHKKESKDNKDGKPQIDYRELNTQLKEGKNLDDYVTPDKKKIQFGGPGWQFRMRKLSRLHEQAEEQLVLSLTFTYPPYCRILLIADYIKG